MQDGGRDFLTFDVAGIKDERFAGAEIGGAVTDEGSPYLVVDGKKVPLILGQTQATRFVVAANEAQGQAIKGAMQQGYTPKAAAALGRKVYNNVMLGLAAHVAGGGGTVPSGPSAAADETAKRAIDIFPVKEGNVDITYAGGEQHADVFIPSLNATEVTLSGNFKDVKIDMTKPAPSGETVEAGVLDNNIAIDGADKGSSKGERVFDLARPLAKWYIPGIWRTRLRRESLRRFTGPG